MTAKQILIVDASSNIACLRYIKVKLFKKLSERFQSAVIMRTSLDSTGSPGTSKAPNCTYAKTITLKDFIPASQNTLRFLLGLLASVLFKWRQSSFLIELSRAEYGGVLVGDCIMSTYLRGYCDGYIRLEKRLFFQVLKTVFRLAFLEHAVKRYPDGKFYKVYYANEVTYFSEAARRYLNKVGFLELRFDPFTDAYTLERYSNGCAIRRPESSIQKAYGDVTAMDLLTGEKKLNSLLTREDSYWYMNDVDVNPNAKVGDDLKNYDPQKRTAVVFMHAVSDAQYVYEKDCFLDLHDWFVYTLKVLETNKYNIMIKLHPNFYRQYQAYPTDTRYLRHLSRLYDVDLLSIDYDGVLAVSAGLNFLGPAFTVGSLKEKFGNPLIITHHGTVAVEAAGAGLQAIASTSSPYVENVDNFVTLYRTKSQYDSLISRYDPSQSVIADLDALHRYVYINYVYKKPHSEFLSPYGDMAPKKNDGLYTEIDHVHHFSKYLERVGCDSIYMKQINLQIENYINDHWAGVEVFNHPHEY